MDGKHGIDGKDGSVSLEALEVEQVDDRLVEFRSNAKVLGRVRLAAVLDRGVYDQAKEYEKGDAVSFGGSLFIAQRDTKAGEKPEEGGAGWRLAVKRGRDGRPGKDGKDGLKGEPGAAGRDRVYLGGGSSGPGYGAGGGGA
jgi:integrin beta 3